MTESLLSMFVVSDLHCIPPEVTDGARNDSLLHLPISSGLRRSPLRGLQTLVEKEGLEADVLLCCGDLTNRAVAEGFRLGWKELEGLADSLKATTLLFTPGNHDIDVQDVNGHADLLSCIKAADMRSDLRPTTVGPDRLSPDGFEIYDFDPVRVVNVDTNGRDPKPLGGAKGFLDLETIDSLEAALQGLPPVDCYVLVCHHHPHRHGDIDADDYSEFENAAELLQMMERLPDAVWYIVHGHKHFPRINTISTRATVFSAGSLAGTFRGPQQCLARNQCYHLRVVSDTALGAAHPPVVDFRAWDWAAVRWVDAKDGFNIPRNGGFGARIVIGDLANRIAEFVKSGSGSVRQAAEVVNSFPEIRYVQPEDLDKCLEVLLSKHKIEVLTERTTGAWRQIGVMA